MNHIVKTGVVNPTFTPSAATASGAYEAPVALNPEYVTRSLDRNVATPHIGHQYTTINDLVLESSIDDHNASVVPISADSHSYAVPQPFAAPNTQYQLFQDLPPGEAVGSGFVAYAVAVPQGGTTFVVPLDPTDGPPTNGAQDARCEQVSDEYVEVADIEL